MTDLHYMEAARKLNGQTIRESERMGEPLKQENFIVQMTPEIRLKNSLAG